MLVVWDVESGSKRTMQLDREHVAGPEYMYIRDLWFLFLQKSGGGVFTFPCFLLYMLLHVYIKII